MREAVRLVIKEMIHFVILVGHRYLLRVLTSLARDTLSKAPLMSMNRAERSSPFFQAFWTMFVRCIRASCVPLFRTPPNCLQSSHPCFSARSDSLFAMTRSAIFEIHFIRLIGRYALGMV